MNTLAVYSVGCPPTRFLVFLAHTSFKFWAGFSLRSMLHPCWSMIWFWESDVLLSAYQLLQAKRCVLGELLNFRAYLGRWVWKLKCIREVSGRNRSFGLRQRCTTLLLSKFLKISQESFKGNCDFERAFGGSNTHGLSGGILFLTYVGPRPITYVIHMKTYVSQICVSRWNPSSFLCM